MPNFAALRAAVFPLSTKNLRGGGSGYPPPVGARVNLTSQGQYVYNSMRLGTLKTIRPCAILCSM